MRNDMGPSPARQTYLDFELEIGLGSGREYPIAVVRSPAGEARETLRFPFDELALEGRLDKLQIALLRSGGQRRRVMSPEEQAVQDFGRALFDALLTGEVRSRYDVSQREATGQGKGLRLKLRIQPPELAALPWEYLYDSRQAEYVCLSRNTPVVRYLELPQPILPLTVTPPLRILGMIASPNDLPLLDVARERQRVENALQALRANGLVEMTWLEGQTWRDLQRAMRMGPWHVFHFIGHGGYDRQTEEGCIALADEEGQASRLSATQLGRLLADHRSLRMVLLNACEGARGSEHDIFSSAAAILVRRGIPAVLAMQYEITDRAAVEFARTFYEALTDEMPVDEAVTEARKAISMMVANTVEWGTPVLYMRSPDGMLFNLREQAQLAQAARRAQEEAERLERERIEREAQEKAARERAIQEARRKAKEKTERQARLAAERAEAERLERERQAREIQRLEQELECAERERTAQLEAESKPAAPPIENKLATSAPFASDMPLSLEVVQQQWSRILEVLKTHSHPMLVALMSCCKPISMEGNTLVLNWPTEMLRSKYEDIKTKRLVEEIISEAVGVHVVTQCVVSDEAKLAAERAGAERLEQERLERKKAAREEAERQAREQAEMDERLERERREREASIQAAREAERRAREGALLPQPETAIEPPVARGPRQPLWARLALVPRWALLAASLGGLFVVGLICIVAVFFIQRGQAGGSQAVANATIAARNAATISAATAAAQPTEAPLPTDTPSPTDTPVPPPTNTPVVVTPAPPTATEAPLPTAAPVTPGKASATPTKAKPTSTLSAASASGGTATSGGVAATTTPEGTMSQTGVGGFGLVVMAAVLIVVLSFIVGLIRLVQLVRRSG